MIIGTNLLVGALPRNIKLKNRSVDCRGIPNGTQGNVGILKRAVESVISYHLEAIDYSRPFSLYTRKNLSDSKTSLQIIYI